MVTSLSFDHMTGENREYPKMQVNEMHTPYDKHHRVSSKKLLVILSNMKYYENDTL